jgi:hypothetical protein
MGTKIGFEAFALVLDCCTDPSNLDTVTQLDDSGAEFRARVSTLGFQTVGTHAEEGVRKASHAR